MIAKRAQLRPLPALRRMVSAGEALNPEVIAAFRERARPGDPRRLRPDRDRPADRQPGRATRPAPARWAGPCRASSFGSSTASSSCARPPARRSSPATSTSEPLSTASGGQPATCVREDEDGYLFFEGRADDVIISAGYRIGPFEVESALGPHPAVAEAAVVAAPDHERGSVVRAIVVLRDGRAVRRARPRAAGPRQARDRARTSTRGSSSSPTSCRRRRAARSSAPSFARDGPQCSGGALALPPRSRASSSSTLLRPDGGRRGPSGAAPLREGAARLGQPRGRRRDRRVRLHGTCDATPRRAISRISRRRPARRRSARCSRRWRASSTSSRRASPG